MAKWDVIKCIIPLITIKEDAINASHNLLEAFRTEMGIPKIKALVRT